ncbi:TetR/AcrR family transcriptional regulator [Nocardiopsis potens]|uniref:TetR/AcrR family transcriptional regulator n=1 Tax=Nocardiopsis potens TaxID=1246458 RepID=UPI00034DD986|nr:TetR/AcrR family transcriptional regulator [Nocardiopsis potens]
MGSDSGRRRPGYAPGGRRDAILDAAMDEFADGGYNGTSLAKVAERAGITQQGLLHYFPSKQALLVAVLEQRDAANRSATARAAGAGGEDGEDGTARIGAAEVAEIVRRNTGLPGLVQVYTVLSAEAVTEGHPAHGFFGERFERLRTEFTRTLREEHGGRLRPGVTPEDAATLLIAVMDGLQVQWLYDQGAVDMPRLVEVVLDALSAPADSPAD